MPGSCCHWNLHTGSKQWPTSFHVPSPSLPNNRYFTKAWEKHDGGYLWSSHGIIQVESDLRSSSGPTPLSFKGELILTPE